MYFVMKVAVARLGGVNATAELLGVPVITVKCWTSAARRVKPSRPTLRRLSDLSGISLESFLDYYKKVQAFQKLKP